MSDQQQLKMIELRELQPILRRAFDDRLIVVRYMTKSLLPPGENYGSTILSVHAVIKRDNERNEEDLYLIAKMSPPTEFQRMVFDSPYTFRKEIFMYEHILPSYNQLEKEAGLKEEELFDVLPKYYQSRLSLNPEVDFDDNAVILMEDLMARGYYTGDRTKGYDLEHSKVAIKAMARFHALGMAVKYKNPEYFEILKKRSKCVDFEEHVKKFEDAQEAALKKLEQDPQLVPYIDRCKAVLDNTGNKLFTAVPLEPWSTIIHSDFWVNNIMFHRDENGRVNDVKFVDFQNYLFLSPIRELIFYIFSSTVEEIRDDEKLLEELIDLYYETFLKVLERMGCDTRPFLRDKFDAQLPDDAKFEFLHLWFMLKVLMLETKFNYDEVENVMTSYQGNQASHIRLRKVILYFIKRNWI